MTRWLMTLVISSGMAFSPTVLDRQQEQQEETAQQEALSEMGAKRLEKIREYIGEAGELFKDKDYSESGKRIRSAWSMLERAAREGNDADREALQKEYRRIVKAHELLAAEGVELVPLTAFPDKGGSADGPDGGADGEAMETVSFKNQVEALLVEHCGRCHVNGAMGQFSMPSFDALLAAANGEGEQAVVAGKPEESLIVKLMDNGSMPKRATMPKKDIDLIRAWIKQGANFDGEDSAARLQGPDANSPSGSGLDG